MDAPTLIANRYVLEEEIGRGAMGVIYRGEDRETAVPVAIKMLNEQVVTSEPDILLRFQQEGELLRQLNHPNIVKMLATDAQNGRYFLVMEYMPGGDLRQHLRRSGQLPLDEVLNIALDLADALARTHRLNILHRDLKPANVLLDAQGLPRLTDFGVARHQETADLTQQGALMGTIAYLSPEGCVGESLDERADIWSFGVLLYEMLAGKRPFDAPNIPGILRAILDKPVPPLYELRPDVPVALDELIERMLVKDRAQRIPSVRQVAAELEAILKGHDVFPLPPMALRSPPTTARTAVTPHNLPRQTSPFVGRQQEIDELLRLLTDPTQPMVTIVGPGGMGKTRLVLEIGRQLTTPLDEQPTQEIAPRHSEAIATKREPITHRQPFPDGVFFVPLASLTDPANITIAIAEAQNYRFHSDTDPKSEILALLQHKRLLLILDNFEHLLTPAAKGLVTDILQAANNIKLCITSRQRLQLQSETSFSIGGLDFPADLAAARQTSAAQLFVQSAKRAQFDFDLQTEALPHVADICRLVQGMPLAIVLAAAWVDMMPLADIVQEIQQDVDFLETGAEDLPARQRSMRATFNYSWQLLPPQEQNIFRCLAVFRGGFTRHAAKAVGSTSLRLLSRLVSRSLLHYDPVQDRYTIHELLRQFAEEELIESGQLVATQQAHSLYYLQMVAASEADLRGGDQKGGLARLTADLENIRVAWRTAAETADFTSLDYALEGLHLFFYLNAQGTTGMSELRQTVRQLAAYPEQTSLRLRLLNRIYWLAPNDSRYEANEIETILTHFATQENIFEVAIGQDNQAKLLILQLDFAAALALRQKSVHQLAELDESFYRSRCYINMAAHTASQLGRLDLFLEAGEQSYLLTQAAGDFLGMRIALHMKAAHALFFLGDYGLAARQYEEAIEAAHRAGGLNLAAQSLPSLGFARFLLGEWETAVELTETALEVFGDKNDPLHLALAKRNEGFLQLAKSNFLTAQQALAEAMTLTKEVAVVGTAMGGLALAACMQGDFQLALTYLQLLLGGILRSKSYITLLWYLPAVVALLVAAKRHKRALELLALGETHSASPKPWWDGWPFVQRLSAELQHTISEAGMGAIRVRGEQLDLAETAVLLQDELAKLRL